MLARIALKAAALVAVAVLALVPLAACGGGGHHDDFDGTLEVANDISGIETIERIDIDEIGGPDSFTYDFLLVDPGESFFVDLFPADYDVTIYWNDATFETHTVPINDDFTTTLTVANP
jgi:hypothetical protein